jgi:predicted site-specific integrase-resolvase
MSLPYFNAQTLAPRFHVTAATLLRWARRGVIPCLRGSRRPVLFDAEAVEQALRARAARQGAAAETCDNGNDACDPP